MNTSEKLNLLRKKMKERALDAYYIPSADPHMSEYLPENYKTRQFMSGFTGSAGTLLVLQDSAYLWTDGRYFIQAEAQLAGSSIALQKMGQAGVPKLEDFLAKRFEKGGRIGTDGKTLSVSAFKTFAEKAPKLEFITDLDLVGEIWTERPQAVASQAFILEEKYTGERASSKLSRLRKLLNDNGFDATIICSLDDICYLYNIRAADVHCNPVLTSYAFVDGEQAYLFVNKAQVSDTVQKDLQAEGISILPYEEIFSEAEKIRGSILLDPATTNFLLFSKIKAKVTLDASYTVKMKAQKNKTEIENIRKTMLIDGVAMVKFLFWLSQHADKGIRECDAVQKLHEFRAEGAGYISESFDTIAGYAENAAIVHYAPVKDRDKKLEAKGMLLLDSGAHYMSGTTDITRTIPLGKLSDAERIDYTLVLKSHINLALAKFKAGVTGFALDTLARAPLWAAGKDFNHGTGHGVGFVLSVHEGPQSISQRYYNVPFEEGMITSNEPGIYIAGKYGIRIESLTLCVKDKKTTFGEFFRFETLTICPISTEAVKKDLLNAEEIAWLNEYNEHCYRQLAPHLNDAEKTFLKEACKAI